MVVLLAMSKEEAVPLVSRAAPLPDPLPGGRTLPPIDSVERHSVDPVSRVRDSISGFKTKCSVLAAV